MLEELRFQFIKNKNLEDILEKYNWKNFETIISEIFKENEFHTKQNFRFKTKRRYEIDILAIKNNQIFCVDCKWWGKGRYKKTGLKHAAMNQENRVKEFRKFLKKNPIARSMLRITQNYIVYPLLVTLHEEDMAKDNNTFIVPAWKVNKFIIDVENYI